MRDRKIDLTRSILGDRGPFVRKACKIVQCIIALTFGFATPVVATENNTDDSQWWALHGQFTNIWQYNPAFHSLYQGPQSFDFNNRAAETTDATLYAGLQLWRGGELWVDPELNQGIALGNTLGVAGYINGDGSKEGRKHPYARIQRLFFRETIDLGSDVKKVEADQNQFAQATTEDRLVITLGKFDVTDVFDTNELAHDGRTDFLNWALIDTGSFDYASDAWGYTLGGAAEWYEDAWAIRSGIFDLSSEPNGTKLTPSFGQFQIDEEIGKNFQIFDRKGTFAVTGFLNRGRMGSYVDAVRLAELSGHIPDTGAVRLYQSRVGVSVNGDQEIADNVALFIRAGLDDGSHESFEYTDIDRTLAFGGRLMGSLWSRSGDEIGLAGVVNWIGQAHQTYLATGGLGILIGDGKLIHEAPEQIAEIYYSIGFSKRVHLTFDGQLIANPAYNEDRGPIPVFGARLHIQD